MSTTNAAKQREEMITFFKAQLKTETSTPRIQALEKSITIAEEELQQIKKSGGKLFGKSTPLKQDVTIVEYDRDSQTYKTTFIPKEPNKPIEVKVSEGKEAQDLALSTSPNPLPNTKEQSNEKTSSKKLGNKLRDRLELKAANSKEDSLKAKVAAAKAAAARDAQKSKK